MAGTLSKRIEGWIASQLAQDNPPSRFVLLHAHSEGRTGAKVREWVPKSSTTPLDLARAVVLAAEDDAEGFGTRQTYAIVAYTAEEVSARKTFQMMSAHSDDSELGPSEPPTAAGLVAQSQRHLENVLRITSQERESLARMRETTVDHLVKMLEAANARETKVAELREQLEQTRLELLEEAIEDSREEDFRTKALETISAFAPYLGPILQATAASIMRPMLEAGAEPNPATEVAVEPMTENKGPESPAVEDNKP